MAFAYWRTIRFHETDAAGVVYFANVLTLCHEAYEASLSASGINLGVFFNPQKALVALPITHAEVDFRRPLQCGDEVLIELLPNRLDSTSFEVSYTLYKIDQANPDEMGDLIANGLTRHVCIDSNNRKRQDMTAPLVNWLNYAQGVTETGSE
jgi:1,4-dihydroxy-2-naphthoyl-CoA hydrolase